MAVAGLPVYPYFFAERIDMNELKIPNMPPVGY
jgi:hypothetical protein